MRHRSVEQFVVEIRSFRFFVSEGMRPKSNTHFFSFRVIVPHFCLHLEEPVDNPAKQISQREYQSFGGSNFYVRFGQE
jgi:hypothetical protein